MNAAALHFVTGSMSSLETRLVFMPVGYGEHMTQQVFERLAKALRIPLTSQEVTHG